MDITTQTLNDSLLGVLDKIQKQQGFLDSSTAIIIFMSVITFLGICGNVLTVMFYSRRTIKKTPTVVMIKYLAIVDLVVCFFAVIAVLDSAAHIEDKFIAWCKSVNFLSHWFIMTSVMVLCAISVERYRKMCAPHGRQFTVRSAFWTVVILTTICMVLSMHSLITFDIIDFNVTSNNFTITGHACTNAEDEHVRVAIVFFYVLDACIIMTSFILFVVMYGTISYTLRQHNKSKFASLGDYVNVTFTKSATGSCDVSLETASIMSDRKTDTMPVASSENSNESTHNCSNDESTALNTSDSNGDAANVPIRGIPSKSNSNSTMNLNKITTLQRSRTDKSETQVTMMMLAISVAFGVCFIPYFIVVVYVGVMSRRFERNMIVWANLAVMSPFWNSVVNPFIFCAFNSQYRQYIKDIFTRCFNFSTCKCLITETPKGN